MGLLPKVESAADFYPLLRQPGQWDDAVAEIRVRHKIEGPIRQSTEGSTVVLLSGQACIKLHPPIPGFLASQEREVVALRCLAGRLPIPTPEIMAEGELEGWTYFVAKRLRGEPINAVWGTTTRDIRVELATQLGRAIRAMHEVDATALAEVTDHWPEFRSIQRARCLEQEREKRLDARRLRELEEFLEATDALDEGDLAPCSLLHTEIGPSHTLVDGNEVTGLIDFGDAMVGDPEYDFAPVGLFVTQGDAAAFGAFGRAYGLTEQQLTDPARPARLMRHAVLHRYATLAWYLDTLDPPDLPLNGLAQHWFGVA